MYHKSFYEVSHLVVAAIRIFEHQHTTPPCVEEVCQMLSFSLEQGNLICKKLHEMEVIEITSGGYGRKIFIRNHLKLEDIPKTTKEKNLVEEIEKFQNTKKDFKQKIKSFQIENARRKKELFAELESQLKKELDK